MLLISNRGLHRTINLFPDPWKCQPFGSRSNPSRSLPVAPHFPSPRHSWSVSTTRFVHLNRRHRNSQRSGSREDSKPQEIRYIAWSVVALVAAFGFWKKEDKDDELTTAYKNFDLGHYDVALKGINNALGRTLQPKPRAIALNKKAYCLNQLSQFQEAVQCSNEALDVISTLSEDEERNNLEGGAYTNKANAYQHLNQHDVAHSLLQKAVCLVNDESTRISIEIILANTLFDIDRLEGPCKPDEAYRLFTKVIVKLESKVVDGPILVQLVHAYSGQASALLAMGRNQEAKQIFLQVERMAPPQLIAVRERAKTRIALLDQVERRKKTQLMLITPWYMGVVTHLEYAQLATAAYDSTNSQDPKNWGRLGVVDQDSCRKDGYYGTAFINSYKKEVVIAHRGTELATLRDLLANPQAAASAVTNFIRDLKTDGKLALGQMDIQFVHAEKFTSLVESEIRGKPSTRDYKISHTGHSLGAALAEVMAFVRQGEAVTFESPGVSSLLKKKAQTQQGQNEKIELGQAKLITYRSEPNVVNTCSSYPGEVRRIYPPLPDNAGLFDRHSMSYILNEFIDSDAMQLPPTWRTIVQWPLNFAGYRNYEQIRQSEFRVPLRDRAHFDQPALFAGAFGLKYKTKDSNPYRFNLETSGLHHDVTNFLKGYKTPGDPLEGKNTYKIDERILEGYRLEKGKIVVLKMGWTADDFKSYMTKVIVHKYNTRVLRVRADGLVETITV